METRKRARGDSGGTAYNGYTGWVPKETQPRIDEVSVEDLDWVSMFNRYVAKRRPVLIKGLLRDEEWRASELWSNSYLKEHAGGCSVRVERRRDRSGSFGEGRYSRMPFRTFLEKLEGGDVLHYLTSQAPSRDNLAAPPLLDLEKRGDFPMRPAFLRGLVPASLNLWVGSSADGSSSGLHHDYHDNLYILLKGRKRFTLYDPSRAAEMATRGTIHAVHPNGLINYVGKETCADGSTACTQQKDIVSVKVRVMEAEQVLKNRIKAEPKGSPLIEEAEEELEEALAEMLDLQEDFGEMNDDYDGPSASCDDSEPDDQDEGSAPLNFSTLTAEQQSGLSHPIEVEVTPGHMLYLPSGWFHNVRSFNSGDKLHMAFNYWFHPPDGRTKHTTPYLDDYWELLWRVNNSET